MIQKFTDKSLLVTVHILKLSLLSQLRAKSKISLMAVATRSFQIYNEFVSSLILIIYFLSASSTMLIAKHFSLFYENCSGIQKQISTSSPARKFLALTLIKVSLAYTEMRRIYEVCEPDDVLFSILYCLIEFFCLFLLVMPGVLISSLLLYAGSLFDKKSKASNIYCFVGGLVVGESSCVCPMAIAYVG